VYVWKGESGALHLSNDLAAIPESQRATATEFTSKLVGKSAPEGAEAVITPSPESGTISLYERGLERGLQLSERQVALAGELARSLLAAAPSAPPIRIVIQQPAQTIIRYVAPDSYAPPFYGFIGPYLPYSPYGFGYGYSFGYGYGFGRGRFAPHSHFFPGTCSRRIGLFFPHGHFSQDGFLFGHGFVVR